LMLNGESETNIEASLESADWLVISFADVQEEQISLLRRFFSERPNLLRDRNVILFSFTAPYYLDATDITKVTAYYALYSKQPAFVEIAARLLFQQIALQGASPVSIPGIYDLIIQTSPDPTQIIPLALDQEVPPTSTTTSEAILTPTITTAEPTKIPLYRIGDTISVRAGPILDHNQHIVPDRTVVRFMMSTRDEIGQILQQVEATTFAGIARASFAIDEPGKVEISVVSERAVISEVLQLDASNAGAAVTVIVRQVTMTPTVITPSPTAVPPENDLISPEGYPRVGIWLLVLLAISGGAVLAFWAVSRIVSPRWGLRWALCVFLGGLLAYNYLALDFPGAAEWIASEAGAFGVLLLAFAGEVIGALGAWIWLQWFSERVSPAD